MQKLRVRYAKRGRMRFTSHRDLARAFERTLRRTGVPMAYSQGFNPHPKVSWAGAVPTGVASEAEYVELQLVERVDPGVVRDELDAALPAGMDVLDVVEATSGSLADRLEASRWCIQVPGVSADELRHAVERLLAESGVEVERMGKDGMRTLDARAAVVAAEVVEPVTVAGSVAADSDGHDTFTPRMDDWPTSCEPYGILVTVVRQTTPVVRPDDVLSALRVVADLAPSAAPRAVRWEQGRLDDTGVLADPLAQDRAAAGARRGEPAAG
ncbi:DUF2344 domain-containing protein [Allosaccharopolyspora coralli]|uniref:DUF2344 domain-containing protein n=1 Tax=Allosaccharopolyspora coralli TaxID=2665642 RepID=A0A5Q3Q3M8_9PSEU|nr:TIGR03936 family radical SAM-associated protein [Allosaccharopolyspora coralli]QGK69211.1 DUF2344 domain-containing protein [Allosaccharopolyspora coralli]